MAKKAISSRKPVSKKSIAKKALKKVGGKMAQSETEESFWQQTFIITQHWRSDLRFFNDEVSFFSKLIDKYLIQLVDESNLEKTKKLVSDLISVEKERDTLETKISSHLEHLTNLIENAFAQNAPTARDEHVALAQAVVEFNKQFRSLKSEVYNLTEHVMESERARHLLANT